MIDTIGYLASLFFILGSFSSEKKTYLKLFILKDICQIFYYAILPDYLVLFVTSLYIIVSLLSFFSFNIKKYENYIPFIVALLTFSFGFNLDTFSLSVASIFYGFMLIKEGYIAKLWQVGSNSVWLIYGIHHNINPLIILCICIYLCIIRSLYKMKKQ